MSTHGAYTPTLDDVKNKDSGNTFDQSTDSLEALSEYIRGDVRDDIDHIEKFTGHIYFVDASGGDDANDGEHPDEAFATIGAAISAASAGDAITVKAGSYDENGLNMNKVGLELWGEIGATIIDTSGGTQTLLVSATSCRVRVMIVAQAGQIGIKVTGAGTWLEANQVTASTVAYDIDAQTTIIKAEAFGYTTTGFDLNAEFIVISEGAALGALAGTRGFYFSGTSADHCLLDDCSSVANDTAGFEAVSGADYNIITHSNSGGGDGAWVDNGEWNMWDIEDMTPMERHELTYPIPLGQGVAADPVTIDNIATDDTPNSSSDKNYWGDIVPVVPPDTLTSRWTLLGIYIYATTGADVQPWEIFLTNDKYKSAQSGGNDWDLGETALTVADGTKFSTGDYVWITGNDKSDGEILTVGGVAGNVVTVASETRMSGNTGLRYNYDATAVGNTMYVVYRPTQRNLQRIMGDHSAAGNKEFERNSFHDFRMVLANGGLLMRMQNSTDAGDSSFDVRVIYN